MQWQQNFVFFVERERSQGVVRYGVAKVSNVQKSTNLQFFSTVYLNTAFKYKFS